MPTEAWAPSPSDVAKRIPTRTRDTRTPGSDRLLGTFTPDTTPDDGQAYNAIEAAVTWVRSQTGDALDLADPEMTTQARTTAEWRAAADIELSYPNRDADIRVYTWLDQRAKDEMGALIKQIEIKTGEPPGGIGGPGGGFAVHPPAWKAPPPPPWADRDPDSPYLVGGRNRRSYYVGSPGTGSTSSRTADTTPGEG
jgi:hypothetical protein